jgi:hypothetical protein
MTDGGTTAPDADRSRFERALRRFDEENGRDPNTETVEDRIWPRELLYAHRLSEWVLRLCPEASEALRLAARCQHLCRWMIPRADYPMDRAGYLRWRSDLKAFHARKAGEILRAAGYGDELIGRVQALNLKTHFPADPEARVMEDALCLVFLQHQFADLAAHTEEAKVLNALRKSWKKMTPAARAEALRLPLASRERELLKRALREPEHKSGGT